MSRPPFAATVALILPFVLSSSVASAQSGTAEIWGRVADMAGHVIVGASVTATNIDTGGTRHTTTDARGRFAFPLLPAARYQVTATRDGYADRRQDDIVLLPGARMAIAMQLREALLPETIALSPFPPILESARTYASAFVASTEIQDLPVVGLRYLRLATLTPAVSSDTATGGLSVMDFPTTANRIVVDGFDQTSTVTGEPLGREGPKRVPYQFGLMSVDAYRVDTNAAPATVGRATAAAMDVVTTSGTNAFHGSGYEFFGDRALNGKTLLDEDAGLDKPPYRNNQFGALIGGPIARDRHFFLLSIDELRRTGASTATLETAPFAPVGAATLAPLQHAFGRPARDEHQDLLLARTDHQFGGARATLRYVDQQFTGTPIAAASMQPAITSDGLADIRTRSGAASIANTLGAHAINEVRLQYADVHDGESAPSAPAAVVLQGGSFVGQTGASLFGPHTFTTRRFQFSDEFSLVAGGHSLTFGGDALRDRNRTRFLPSATFGFRTIAAFDAGAADWVTQTSDTGAIPLDVAHYSGYIQDAWRATSSFTVDLGARYDVQQFSSDVPAARRNNWAPRVGIAFAPGTHTHVFRAAYGVMYGTTPALIPALALGYGPTNVHAATGPLPSIVTMDPSFNVPRVQQASAGWEFEKYRVGSLGVEYLFAKGEHLARPVEADAAGQFPGVGRVVTYESTGESLYNGVSLHVRAKLLQQLFYTIAYTFSRMDETPLAPVVPVVGGWNERVVLARAGGAIDTRAPGDTDQHHNLSLSALYDTTLLVEDRRGMSRRLLENWNAGLVYTLQSGQPYSAFVNGDLNADGNPFNDLAPSTTWNQYRLPWQASIDPRVARDFSLGGTRRLALIWQAFNIANRPNFTAVDTTMTSLSGTQFVPNPQFGRKTAVAAGRMMQVAVKLTF